MDLPEGIVGVPANGAALVQSVTDLFESEEVKLIRLAIGLTGDRPTAEDLVQDAFAALQRRWSTLTDQDAAAG